MKLIVQGNTKLLQHVELSRNLQRVLCLYLQTTERGATFYLGANGQAETGNMIEGPLVIIAPPEGEGDGKGCEILVEGETPEEKTELRDTVMHTSQSKDNLCVAFLAGHSRGNPVVDTWEPETC